MSLQKSVLVLLMAGAIACLPAEGRAETGQRPEQLQQRYRATLKDIGSEVRAYSFPYPFYLSRVLDVDRPRLQPSDEGSIRFDTYKGHTVLVLTGNYYAAYSAERMDSSARLKESFERVIMPVLQLEVSHFTNESDFLAFAIEISHHVQQEVGGVTSERPENVTMIIPVPVARRLVQAKTEEEKQAAVVNSQVFLNGEAQVLWVAAGDPSHQWKSAHLGGAPENNVGERRDEISDPKEVHETSSSASPGSIQTASTSESLAALQRQYQSTTDRIIEALGQKAQLKPSAPPAFVRFRESVYLQLAFPVALDAAPGSSRYRLAALAFDEQISHLIAPLPDHFPSNPGFDGLSFRVTIQLRDGSTAEVVEFSFPFPMLRCFSSYDCTGQRLLDSGVILINGVRSALDLQVAEGRD